MPDDTGKQCPLRSRWFLVAAGAAGAAAVLWANRRYLTVRSVRTGETPEYPDIVPQVFADPIAKVRDAAVLACASLPGWEVTDAEGDDIRVAAGECTCRRREVCVRLEPIFDGRMTRVSVSSACEGHLPDFGANARGIRAFQARMRELLSSGGGDAG